MILSTESLNVEPTVSNTQDNVFEKQNIAKESDIVDEKLNDIHIKTEGTFVNSEEKIKSDSIENEEIKLEQYTLKTETQLPQPSEIKSTQHEQESSGNLNSEDNNV